MRFYGLKLLILFMIVAAGATFYYFGDTQKLFDSSIQTLEKTPLKNVAKQAKDINQNEVVSSIKGTIQNAEAEFSQLSSRTQEVKKQTDNILKTTKSLNPDIEATKDSTPIQEKVFEYGKYVYCKSVVKDYESSNEQ